ncbi:MAG: LemA family protein [Clostridia bacterium]|nr:LemA family protein [Clostridia bacterium]
MLIFLSVVFILIIAAFVFLIMSYNSLCKASVRVDNSWSQIDVQLKKRYDLIPNLVKLVKAYMTFEDNTLQKIVSLRNNAYKTTDPQQKISDNDELTRSLHGIFLSAENYPELASNKNFLSLQTELSNIESKIAMSRQFYNDTVMKYNEKIVAFPTNIIAVKLGYEQRPYFAADKNVENVPDIDL